MSMPGMGKPQLEVGIGADLSPFEKAIGEIRAEIGQLSTAIMQSGKSAGSGYTKEIDKAGKTTDEFAGFIKKQRQENRLQNFVFRESQGAIAAVTFGMLALTSATGDNSKSTQQLNRVLASTYSAFQGVSFAMQALKVASAGLATGIGAIVAIGVGLLVLLDKSKDKAEQNAKAFKRWAESIESVTDAELALELMHAEKELARLQKQVEEWKRSAPAEGFKEVSKEVSGVPKAVGEGLSKAYGLIATAIGSVFAPSVEDAQKRVEDLYEMLEKRDKDRNREVRKSAEEEVKARRGIIPWLEYEIKLLEEQKKKATNLLEVSRLNIQIKQKGRELDLLAAGITAVPVFKLAVKHARDFYAIVTESGAKTKELDFHIMQLGADAQVSFGEKAAGAIDLWRDAELSVGQAIDRVSDAMTLQAGNMQGSFNEMLTGFLNVARQMIAAEIAIGVASAVRGALSTVPFPFNIIAAGIAAAAAKTAFEALVPKLSAGALAFGPTIAMVGDNPNAAINPEVIAPLSELRGMGAQRIQVEVVGRISGRDLVFITDKVRDEIGRITGN